MRKIAIMLFCSAALWGQLPSPPDTPTPIIIDGDIGNDISIDDGFYEAIKLHQLHYYNILALITGGPMSDAGSYASTYLAYAGLGSIPVASYQNMLGPVPRVDGYSAQYQEHDMCAYVNAGNTPQPSCLSSMTARTGLVPYKPVSAYPEPVGIIRNILSAQSDGSVVMIETGPGHVFDFVLTSAAQGADSRSGSDLIAAKVAYLVVMGGQYPSGPEWNFYHAPSAAANTYANWPTPIYYVTYEFGFPSPTAGSGIYALPDANPLKIAHQIYGSETRNAWDAVAILFPLMQSTNGYFTINGGLNSINVSSGENAWSAGTHTPARYHLAQGRSDADWSALINSLITVDIGAI